MLELRFQNPNFYSLKNKNFIYIFDLKQNTVGNCILLDLTSIDNDQKPFYYPKVEWRHSLYILNIRQVLSGPFLIESFDSR
jgi:hypothetical protein